MARAKTKSKHRTLTKHPSDKALINYCVTYAQSIAAHRAGFLCDPDSNSQHAATLGSRHRTKAFQSLTWVASTPTKTPEGLCAKACMLEALMEANFDGCFDIAELDFLRSFGREVKLFLQPICDGTATLQAPTPKGGAS